MRCVPPAVRPRAVRELCLDFERSPKARLCVGRTASRGLIVHVKAGTRKEQRESTTGQSLTLAGLGAGLEWTR